MMGRLRASKFVFVCLIFCASVPAHSQTPVKIWWSSEYLPEHPRWFTNPPAPSEIRHRLDRLPDQNFGEIGPSGELPVFQINPQKSLQEILGIGTSLEATTIYAIRKNKTDAQMREVLKALIDPINGLGFNLFRITIGTSDFSDGRSVSQHPKGYYTYQDDENAPFSIQNDIDLNIISTLKLAQEVAASLEPPREILFFASCWSPPAWMKTSNNLICGTLKKGYEKRLARYFRNFVEAYQTQGIPIYAMTMQNEPNFLPAEYPGMKLTPAQERDLVIATYEEFADTTGGKKTLDVKLWINDHNFDNWQNADTVLTGLEQLGKKYYVDATAFHNYTDAPASNMTLLHERHPAKRIVFTEHSEWGVAGMYNLQQYFWNWSTSYMYWVTMSTQKLDEHNQGPYNRLGELSPTLFIQEDGASPEWYKTPEVYLISQFSRFIQRGARRIDCERGSPEFVTLIAFENPDESFIAIMVNQTNREQRFKLRFEGRELECALPLKTAGTYVWRRE